MLNSKKIADLEARVTELEGLLAASDGKATGFEAQLNQARIDLAAAQEEAKQVATLKTQVTTLEGSVASLTTRAETAEKSLADAKADFETKVNAEVTTRLAGAGTEAIPRDPHAKKGEGKDTPDASLPPRQRATEAMKGFAIFGGGK